MGLDCNCDNEGDEAAADLNVPTAELFNAVTGEVAAAPLPVAVAPPSADMIVEVEEVPPAAAAPPPVDGSFEADMEVGGVWQQGSPQWMPYSLSEEWDAVL